MRDPSIAEVDAVDAAIEAIGAEVKTSIEVAESSPMLLLLSMRLLPKASSRSRVTLSAHRALLVTRKTSQKGCAA